jgi:two-component system chemotaxis sensor kinase CheA
LRLRDAFQLGDADWRRENIVVVRFGNLKAGIVVDELLGELQTVIKPLGKLFTFLQGIGGSTILGTGEVALILDVPGLIKHAEANKAQALAVA